MVKKTILYFSIILFWVALAIGASSALYYYFVKNEYIANYERYGDLYRFSNLPQFKQKQIECKRQFGGVEVSKKLDVALYTIGDSFLRPWRINEYDFPYKYYRNISWEEDHVAIQLDSTVKNVLLLECVERHTRERFNVVPKNYILQKDIVPLPWTPPTRLQRVKNKIMPIWEAMKTTCFTPETADHLEHMFFSADWILPIKELKAAINLDWFNRVNSSAGMSKDKKHIFYFKDMDTSMINSTYKALADSELNKMVANVDSTIKAYKSMGFDEVFVSVIPNKSSILAPNDGIYNHLAERFEKASEGKFETIDIYKEYVQNRNIVFGINETHWTCFGKNIWVKNAREKIENKLKIVQLTQLNYDKPI
jgi:hypothetical protein